MITKEQNIIEKTTTGSENNNAKTGVKTTTTHKPREFSKTENYRRKPEVESNSDSKNTHVKRKEGFNPNAKRKESFTSDKPRDFSKKSNILVERRGAKTEIQTLTSRKVSSVENTLNAPITNKPRVKKVVLKEGVFYATGKRKTSIARVWIFQNGKGEFVVNGKSLNSYFPRLSHQVDILKPMDSTQTVSKFDIKCTVEGGGMSGQAGALRLGIAKALLAHNLDFKPILRSNKLLTRDSRIVERKKYGQHGARKKTQFSKR